jgi:hypothetical protein
MSLGMINNGWCFFLQQTGAQLVKKISKNVTVDQLSNAKNVANVGNPIINLPFGGWFIPPMKK